MRLFGKSGIALLFVAVSFQVYLIEACGSKKPKPDDKPDKPSDDSSKPKPAVKNMMGDKVKTDPLDNKGFDDKGGQASSPADLKCDFSGPCCWKNAKPPFDTMEWVKGSGEVDADKFQKNFDTSSTPSGNFLLTAADGAAGPADKAEFMSCTIPCAGDSVKVTVKHWQSSGVKIQVCEVAKSDPNTLLGCQDLPAKGPGPDTVTLPPGENINIAIVAYNLVAKGGNVAIIQDINVDYPPCGSSTAPADSTPVSEGATTPPAGSTPAPGRDTAECQKIACNFEDGTCKYVPGAGSGKGKDQPWTQAGPGPFKNPATGVGKSADNSRYAAAYLKPGESAYMESEGNTFDTDKQIKFQEYKATEGISLKACCDTMQGCSYDSGKKVEKGDFRQWYQGGVTCKQGTQKVIFLAENTGNNEGGVGIDNVQVFDASGGQQLC